MSPKVQVFSEEQFFKTGITGPDIEQGTATITLSRNEKIEQFKASQLNSLYSRTCSRVCFLLSLASFVVFFYFWNISNACPKTDCPREGQLAIATILVSLILCVFGCALI